jgi:hypothetical protein
LGDGNKDMERAIVAALSDESGRELTKDQVKQISELINSDNFETIFADSPLL